MQTSHSDRVADSSTAVEEVPENAPGERSESSCSETAEHAISLDTMTKLLDSARGEVRGYRSLYFTLFGVALLAPPSAIATIYRASRCSGSAASLYMSFVLWVSGIGCLLFGSFSVLPSLRYRGGSNSHEFETIARVSDAIAEEDPIQVRRFLREAIDGTHEIQTNTVDRGQWVARGAILIIIAVAFAFLRWIVNCQEAQP